MSLTIPNLLSIGRMALVPLFIIALLDGKAWQALAIFLVAGVTDMLDGAIARLFHQQSVLGRYLDPAADKLLLVSAYVVLAVPGVVKSGGVPVWVTVLVLLRDVIIVVCALVLYLAHHVTTFNPTMLSKVNTVAQIATVGIVLAQAVSGRLELLAVAAVYIVAVLTVASGLDYIWRANQMVAEAKRDVAA